MKILILAVVFLSALLVHTASADDFSYTGNTAQAINFINDWSPGTPGYVGGPGGDDVVAIAQQFTVSQETSINDLNVNATVSTGEAEPDVPPSTVNFDLYTGSLNFGDNPKLPPVPDKNSLTFASAPVMYPEPQHQPERTGSYLVTNQVAFPEDLQPGTYWLVEQGTNGPFVYFNSITYATANAAQTPEPSLLMFFLVLAGVLLVKGRKSLAGMV